jgi:hypothetical protein
MPNPLRLNQPQGLLAQTFQAFLWLTDRRLTGRLDLAKPCVTG